MHYPVIYLLTHQIYGQATVDREIFALKIIRVKIFRVIKFLQFRLIRKIFFNGRRLQYGRVPEEFLAFSLLPGIRRARDRWL